MKDFKFNIDEYLYYNRAHYKISVECIRKVEYSVPFIEPGNDNLTIEIAVTTNPDIADCIVEALNKAYS
jgi:hypothetical protein